MFSISTPPTKTKLSLKDQICFEDVIKAKKERLRNNKQEISDALMQQGSTESTTDISNAVEQTPEAKLKKFLTPIPLIAGHTLDMTVDDKPIYNHLTNERYLRYFVSKFKNDPSFIERMKLFDEQINELRQRGLYSADRGGSEINIKYRSIVLGSDSGNNDEKGVDGVTYVKNMYTNCSTELRQTVHSIVKKLGAEFNLNKSDATRLFVLRMGLGKYSCHKQRSNGVFHQVGATGMIVVGPIWGDRVPCILFNDCNASLSTVHELGDFFPHLG